MTACVHHSAQRLRPPGRQRVTPRGPVYGVGIAPPPGHVVFSGADAPKCVFLGREAIFGADQARPRAAPSDALSCLRGGAPGGPASGAAVSRGSRPAAPEPPRPESRAKAGRCTPPPPPKHPASRAQCGRSARAGAAPGPAIGDSAAG